MSNKKIFSTKFLVIILFVLICYTSCKRVKRIVGGMPVACGEQLRVASLRNSSNHHFCGATIISADYALTAAHCATSLPQPFVLQLNNFCLYGNATYPEAEVVDVIVHEQYDKYSRAHDIAILQIKLALDDLTWLNDSILPASSFGLSGFCTIFGNGYIDPGTKELSETLQAAEVKIISLDQCVEVLSSFVAPNHDSGMLCALGEHSDACQGDSGGPLMCNNHLEGISSYGMGCGVTGLPGVYTSIGAHLNWINDNIKKINTK